MRRRGLLFIIILGAMSLRAQTPPAAPVIVEPAADRQSVSAADVHMATGPFVDADGHRHRCSDWEIRILSESIWSAPCAAGAHKSHIHLGDGSFAAEHESLRPATGYWLRVRHRDDSGDPTSEWSAWTERFFLTARELPMVPLTMREVLASPAPRWVSTAGERVVPPPQGRLQLEFVDGDVLLTLGRAGDDLATMLRRRFDTSAALRAVLTAGSEEWVLPESELTVHDDDGNPSTIYFPAVTIPPSEQVFYWVSENGGTHLSKSGERAPDFNIIVRGAPVPWRAVQRGFRIERVASGFELPVNIAFVPNPREGEDAPLFYVTELYGTIKVVTRGGEVRDYAANLLDFDPRGLFPGPGEIGLTGIAVEPESGDVIIGLLYTAWPGQRVVWPRIVRLRSEDGGLTAARTQTILDMPNEDQSESHQISNVTIGFDGKLYVHLGDSLNPDLAQDMKTFRGKILRLDLDGSAPLDNPFYDPSDGISAADYIFALGFRNPFGGAWRAADRMLYEIENGPSIDRFAQVVRGRNYLWNGIDESMLNYAICSFHGGTAPVNVAFVQRETFDGSGFPESKYGNGFISESGPTWASGPQIYGKRIEEVVLRDDGTLESGPAPFIEYDGTGKASISGIAAGPDGLYFSGLYKDYGYQSPIDRGADIFRVRWTGFADFRVGLTEDVLGVSLVDESNVPDAEEWEWDFGDGMTSRERNPVHRYDRDGTYVIRLSVTGPRGTVSSAKKIDLRTEGSGLIAEYYPRRDFSGSRHVDSAEAISYDWGFSAPVAGLPAGEFSARWSGRIRPRFSEAYRFSAEAKGTVTVKIDGAIVQDEAVALEAGRLHDIVVEYVHDSGTAALRLLWESDSQPREVVPSSAFVPPRGPRTRAVTK